jgi:hypothetical protein
MPKSAGHKAGNQKELSYRAEGTASRHSFEEWG